MAKRKIKKSVVKKFTLTLIFFILAITLFSCTGRFIGIQRRLSRIGYEDIEFILNMDRDKIDIILSNDYNEHLPYILNQTYFIEEKLEEYLEASENHFNEYKDLISIVNTKNNIQHYEEIFETDISKNELMLVNRFYKLNEHQTFDDLVPLTIHVAYEGNRLREVAAIAFEDLHSSAKDDGFNLAANGTYRSYADQAASYERSRRNIGTRRTDEIIARAGHSEHQSGLSIDIHILNRTTDNFDTTLEFQWLRDNAHKFGFILRYPLEYEHITGFNYEPWHYRYVGKEVATYIYENDITFDEYYAFYLN